MPSIRRVSAHIALLVTVPFDPAAVFGGGDGFSCTTRAAKACAEFLQYFGSEPVQKQLAGEGAGLLVNAAAVPALKTETFKTAFDHFVFALLYQRFALRRDTEGALTRMAS